MKFRASICKVLFLAANPKQSSQLRLGQELRDIEQRIKLSPRGQFRFKLIAKWAVRLKDLRLALLEHKPQIVHFSGHGAGEDGLVLEDDTGELTFIDATTLANFLKLCPSVDCVLLNACYSKVQAEAIADYVPYTIGMNQAIADQDAIQFAEAFYEALSNDREISEAYLWGINSLTAQPNIVKRDVSTVPEESLETDPITPILIIGKSKPTAKRWLSLNRRQLLQILFASIGLGGSLLGWRLFKQSKSFSTDSFDVVTVDARGNIIEQESRQTKSFREELSETVNLEVVPIPNGSFWMGSPEDERGRHNNENLPHEVSISSFWIGKYPITNAQWQIAVSLPQINHELPPSSGASNEPVVNISWNEAIEFCQRLSQFSGRIYRLPTEAEWEHACRAGTTTPFHFGEIITTRLANFDGAKIDSLTPLGISRGKPTDVGSFDVANNFGLYDMHGNVWEWCLDKYLILESFRDPRERRIMRGGGWNSKSLECRSAVRGNSLIEQRHPWLGLRVVCEALNSSS
ncbi:MAG: SUMF1/EgtB/PvdO family nonheme iron enzyme [Cyanobacteria bacterium P01_B01_bin.77]